MDLAHTLQELSVQTVGFLLLYVILKRFAWRPLLGMLDQRRARIEEGLREIAQHKAELARLQHEYGQRLAKIEDEARTKIQQAILEGKRIAVEIQEQARAQASMIITKSKDTVELELAKAKVTLRDHVADMTIGAVERLLRQKLDPKTDRHLVEAALDDLEQLERSAARP
ncbi:MAG: F0F1 ATP synthase subunit B [Candidatus Omnitrophica bacterium]|nr:F0F1 ATP synthase subunit B [Candidatus Omnitrophota bacterium]